LLLVVFATTLFLLIFTHTPSKEAMAIDEGCYWVCIEWCPPLICGAENVCWRWALNCPGDPTPPKK
jgi:hypothetical protein